jgi:hypothetical protein
VVITSKLSARDKASRVFPSKVTVMLLLTATKFIGVELEYCVMLITEERRLYLRKWEKEHRKMTPQRKQAMKIRSRRCYELHRKTILERHKVYAQVHSEQFKEYAHGYYLEHRDSICERQKTYEATHREQVNAEQKARYHVPIESTCELCGSQRNLERHHPNYGAPLAVEIVCHSCHRKIHDS